MSRDELYFVLHNPQIVPIVVFDIAYKVWSKNQVSEITDVIIKIFPVCIVQIITHELLSFTPKEFAQLVFAPIVMRK